MPKRPPTIIPAERKDIMRRIMAEAERLPPNPEEMSAAFLRIECPLCGRQQLVQPKTWDAFKVTSNGRRVFFCRECVGAPRSYAYRDYIVQKNAWQDKLSKNRGTRYRTY